MKKVGVTKLVDFRRLKNQGSKFTLVKNLGKPKEKNDGGGGDYWIQSTSACSSAFWHDDKKYLDLKIEEIKEKISAAEYGRTKIQFQKNIDILNSMQNFDFQSIMPTYKLNKLSRIGNIIQVNNLPIQALPQKIFSYEIGEKKQIGGVWFVAKKGGFENSELGMFTTTLHKYLTKRFSEEFMVDPNYCTAVDISSLKMVNYTQILKGAVPDVLISTIDELNKYIK